MQKGISNDMLTSSPAHHAERILQLPDEESMLLQALAFAGVDARDCLIDLGSGDGRFCIAALQQFHASAAVGVEIDASLVADSCGHAKACGVAKRAHFTCTDLTDTSLDILSTAPESLPFTLAIVFLLPESERLFERHVRRLYDAGAHILSLAFALDRLEGLQLLKSERPMYLYGKQARKLNE